MRLKIGEIVKATGGKLLCGREDTTILSFSADSRDIKGGTMFVPIRGEKTDAHRFMDAVFEQGAAAAFTEEEILPREQPVVLVENTRTALQKTAAYYRARFDIPIVGVTGSAGKTTAKEMVALALSGKMKVLKTAGNQNSQVGVPLTICGLRREHEAAVVEMGVSIPGEMARISAVVKAGYAVITNIGLSHIEFMKTKENTLAEKLRIADYLTGEGVLFVNGDDELLAAVKKNAKYQVVTFGVGRDCDWRAADLRQADNGMFFTCEYRGNSTQIFVPAAGVHNVRNALASLAVAHTLGVGMEEAVRAIGKYKPPAMRQQVFIQNGVTIIDDTYNASPDSMKGALDILAADKNGGRKIAVLGDMLELGDHAYIGHVEVGKYAAGKDIDFLVGVGPLAKDICAGFGENNTEWLDNNHAAAEYVKGIAREGDVVLVKGSRSMKMDEIVEELKEL